MLQADEVWIVEGEKLADNLHSLGLCGTTMLGGAGKWVSLCKRHGLHEPLSEKNIYILPDNDEPGRRHADEIACSLLGFASSAQVVALSGLEHKQDVSDFIAAHGEQAKAMLLKLSGEAPEHEPGPEIQSDNVEDGAEQRFQAALQLFQRTQSEIFTDQHRDGWVAMNMGSYHQNVRLSSQTFTRHILKMYVNRYKQGLSREIIAQLADYLTASAQDQRHLHNRFAWHDDTLLIDLGTPTWDIIRIASHGYEIIKLKRYSHQKALPIPERGGNLRELLEFLPVKDDDSEILLMVWVSTTPLEHNARPGIILHGLQGSGKSTISEFLRNLLDPSSTPTGCLSKDHAGSLQMLDHHAVPVLENLHRLPQWASDDLCRAVTSGGSPNGNCTPTRKT